LTNLQESNKEHQVQGGSKQRT